MGTYLKMLKTLLFVASLAPCILIDGSILETRLSKDLQSKENWLSEDVFAIPGKPERVVMLDVTETSFNVNFSAPSSNVNVKRYQVVVFCEESGRDNQYVGIKPCEGDVFFIEARPEPEPAAPYQYSFKKGVANKWYKVQVRAWNKDGWGEYATIRFKLQPPVSPGKPGKPQRLVMLDVTPTSFNVNWSAPSTPNAKVSGYQVLITCEPDKDQRCDEGEACKSDKNVVEVSPDADPSTVYQYSFKLGIPNRWYKVQVSARNAGGWGESEDLRFRLRPGDPFKPTAVKAAVRAQRNVFIEWKPPCPYTGPTTYYIVATPKRSKPEYHFVSNTWETDSFTVTNLKPDTEYTMCVEASRTDCSYTRYPGGGVAQYSRCNICSDKVTVKTAAAPLHLDGNQHVSTNNSLAQAEWDPTRL